jgi:hypothetical protein
MNILTKEAILAAEDLPRELVNVPEWGGEVYVRTMSGTDRDSFETSLIARSDAESGADTGSVAGAGSTRMDNVRARLVALALCDTDGVRLFDDADIVALGRKSARALDRVFAVAQRLNGIGVEQADATKNG